MSSSHYNRKDALEKADAYLLKEITKMMMRIERFYIPSGGEIVKICGFLASFKYGIQALLTIKVPLVLIVIAKSNDLVLVSSTGVW